MLTAVLVASNEKASIWKNLDIRILNVNGRFISLQYSLLLLTKFEMLKYFTSVNSEGFR